MEEDKEEDDMKKTLKRTRKLKSFDEDCTTDVCGVRPFPIAIYVSRREYFDTVNDIPEILSVRKQFEKALVFFRCRCNVPEDAIGWIREFVGEVAASPKRTLTMGDMFHTHQYDTNRRAIASAEEELKYWECEKQNPYNVWFHGRIVTRIDALEEEVWWMKAGMNEAV